MLMNNIERVGLGHNSKNITLESFLTVFILIVQRFILQML